ncbi:MAG: S-layer homology domain-containing protein [Firmicutes bacterium]|nr:S-layer homology domain-containing protein [Bacillota bacterium]
MKRFLALLLILCLLPVPMSFAQEESPRLITDVDYAAVEALWDEVEALEEAAQRSTRAKTDGETAVAIAQKVEEHPLYIDGTLRWNGTEQFTFETTVGVTCGYSARLSELTKDNTTAEPMSETISYAKRGTTSSVEICLLEPYYGSDSSFTKQYQKEAESLAATLGGTYTLKTGSAATIDAVAEAVERGGVVFFDSHGTTDYEKGNDYVTGATSSYLCLTTGTGLTTKDYANDNGTYHAINFYGGEVAVDGTAIANHMDSDAPDSLLWSAICLGMATDGLHAPLREKGVAVAYGYSQSVTFDYDYKWETVFFRELKAGAYVCDAIDKMKTEVGRWDYCDQYRTLASAVKNYCAFPIVVSDEDVYPGHGNVDALQTVYSTWSLPLAGVEHYTVSAASDDEKLGTVSVAGSVVTATPAEGVRVSGYTLTPENAATVTWEGNVFRLTDVTADCLLTVKFSPKVRATVHYSVPDGCTKADSYGYVGEKITLSSPEGKPTADAYSYSFVGWTETTVSDTKTQPKNYSSSYTPMQAETTLYALYQYYNEAMTKYYTTELKNSIQYGFSAVSNDEKLGSVSVTDNVVTATPTEGAYVDGYTLTPEGAATVTQEGENIFRVENLTADCILTVRFAAKTAAKVTYSVPEGCEKAADSVYVGDALKLTPPAGAPTADAQAYTFVGWTLDKLEDGADAPVYFTDTFTPTKEEMTLYALYTYGKDGVRYYTTVLRSRECYLLRYADADAGAWYHEAIDFAVGGGYMNGVADDRFDPSGTLTRAMLATILYRMSGETGGTHPFTDVPANEWYADAVAWAYTSGVVNGTSATRFSPEAPVTREQTAAMLYRYAKYMGQGITASGNLSVFRDADQISEYAKVPMRWAVGMHILNGKENAALDPTGTATRAEIAQILLNLSKAIPA